MRIHNIFTKSLVITIILISSFLSSMFLNPASGRADLAKSDGVQVLQADIQGLVLDINVPAYDVEMVEINNQSYQRISIEDYGLSNTPGKPELPQRGFLVGVPPDAKVSLAVLATESTIASGFQVAPAPRIEWEKPIEPGWDTLESVPNLQVQFVKDQSVYDSDAFYPSAIAELGDSGYLRDQRWVQVLVHPVQYNPATRELKYHRYIKIQINFSYPEGISATLPKAVAERAAFEAILKGSLVNYDAAKAWRKKLPSQSTVNTLQLITLDSQPTHKIAVDADGIYRVTYGDLQSVGIDVDSIDPRTIKLYNLGTEIPIYVFGQDDGVFNTTDYVEFYGLAPTSRYAVANIYWLAVGGGDGLRMLEKDGSLTGTGTVPAWFKTTARVEKDLYYHSYIPRGETEGHWFWNYVYPPSIPSQTYTTTLEHIATESYTATLRANMHGWTYSGSVYPDHHTKIYLNDILVEDAWWDGQVQKTSTEDFPSSYLVEGVNSIRLECPNDTGLGYDVVFVDWFEIDYHDTYTAENDSLHFSGNEADTWEYHVGGFTTSDVEVFNITDPANVSRIISTTVESTSSYTLKFEDTITDRREYLALTTAQRLSPLSIELDTPSDLHSTSNGADYIIITHSDFYTDVLPLANRRIAQGPRTMVVDVQDIYDEFNYGICDAQAIHDFLAYAYANWTAPSPSYVLLVGDGTVDTKDNLGTGARNYIPPYLADVDATLGETATDNRYVTISGDDILPDMHIGRLPVNSSAEATIMVNKILDYEQTSPPGDWNQKALFVADNDDSAGDFDGLSDDIADNYFPTSYVSQKVYLGVNYPYENPSVQAKAAVIGNIDEGVLLVNYIGHGSTYLWAAEKLLLASDVDLLTNDGKLPMMLPMTCKEGMFHYPNYPCLGESLVRAAGKGAIASWSPTGAGMALGHHYLDQGFFTAVFSDTISEIGQATYLGKLNLYENTTGYRDLMDTYVLFGDPFMKLNLPACDAADFDKDRQITVADIMEVAGHWDNEWGDEGYDRKYDLDNDGDIDIVDIMRVAARWNEEC